MDRLIDIHDIVCTNGGGGSPENLHKICAAAACKEGEKRNGCTCSAKRNPEGAVRRYKRRFFDYNNKIDRSLIPNLSYFDKVNIIQNFLCSTQFQPKYLNPKSYVDLIRGYEDYMALLYQIHDIVCQGAYGTENWKRISISERKLAEEEEEESKEIPWSKQQLREEAETEAQKRGRPLCSMRGDEVPCEPETVWRST